MRFQTRLLLTYTFLILLLVVLLGVAFTRYSGHVFETNAYANLSVVSEKMSQQLDSLVRPMDVITTYLLSDRDFMSSMASLAALDRSVPRNLVYINEGWRTINGTLLSYSIIKNFYSVNVFNRNGDFLTSNLSTYVTIRDARAIVDALSWTRKADEAAGRAVILRPYDDPWAPGRAIPVFGLGRSVQGPKGGMGYLEVQSPYAELERVFSVPEAQTTCVVAVNADADLFYSSRPMTEDLIRHYKGLVGGQGLLRQRNAVTGREEIVAQAASTYTGIRVILVQDRGTLTRPLGFTRIATVLIGALIVAVTFVFNLLSARQLTGPLRRLKETMEGTELGNLPDAITFETTNDEIVALNLSFQRLRQRLGDAVGREMRSQSLQMQARFDSLQAQVNPHFLYNVLTVLSSRGMEAGDDEICEICDSIAAMLRYSTSTATRSASLGEEIEHVRTYLYLMKKRFEDRLAFFVDVPTSLERQPIPKIVLQQIVENSINHGYRDLGTDMRIAIAGEDLGDRWHIEIADNGQGFSDTTLRLLTDRMGEMERSLDSSEDRQGLQIGGMGLVNTYARLLLFYGRAAHLELGNGVGGGARVAIVAPRRSGR